MILLNIKKEVITDAHTLLNAWNGLKCMCNTKIFLSASNFLLLKTLFPINLETVAETDLSKLSGYLDEHKALAYIIDDRKINNAFNQFLENENTYMQTINISKKKNLELVIFKGFYLDKTEDVDLAATIDETVAYAEFRRQNNRAILLITLDETLIDFCREFNFEFEVKDVR